MVTDITDRIRQAIPAEHWIAEGTDAPSDNCRELAVRGATDLASALGLAPNRVDASRPGGVMLVYRDETRNVEMEIEVDNDLDVVVMISSSGNVFCVEEITRNQSWLVAGEKYLSASRSIQ